MSEFDGMYLTKKGKNLMAKGQIGTTINFTKVVLGDGSLAENQNIEDLETIINHKKDVNIHSLTVIGDGTSQVRIILTNQGLIEGFFVREIGLMANDPDEGEILYAYANAGERSDFIPSTGGATVVENQLDLIAVVGNAPNITAEVGVVILALKEDVDNHNIDPAAHDGRLNAMDQAMNLSRLYAPNYVEFEFFVPSWTKLYGMDNKVTAGTAGSDVVSVDKTDDITVGKSYVIFDSNNAESIIVAEIVDLTTIRATANLVNDFSGADIRRTDWTVTEGKAVAVEGGVYYASDLTLLGKNCDKALVIRRQNNDAELTVFYKDTAHPAWTPVPWSWKRDQLNGFIDVEYIVPARGVFDIMIPVSAGASAVDPVIDHHVFVECESGLNGVHRPPETPTIVSPANEAIDIDEQPSITTSAYSHPTGDALLGSQFQISTNLDFAQENIINDSGTVSGVSYSPGKGVLDISTIYYARGRYIDVDNGMSEWSPTISFTTASAFITVNKPVGTAPGAGDELGSPDNLTLVSSAFGTEGGSDTHANSQWQIASNPDLSTIIYDSGITNTGLISQSVPDDTIARDNIYYWRVRHEGTSEGWSDWSNSMMFSVADFIAFVTTLGGAGSDYFRDVAIDSSGNIVAVGEETTSTGSLVEAFIAKFEPSGALIWQKKLGRSDRNEIFYAVEFDADGNIYAAGTESSNATNTGLITKYDSDGTLLWQKSLGGSGGQDYFRGVGVDASGNAYVAGDENSSTGYGHIQALIAKYDSDGGLTWQRKLGGSGDDYFRGIEVDASGNVYVVGEENSSTGGVFQGLIAKYDSDGILLWQKKLGGGGNDYFYDVAVDASGNVYAVGNENSSTGTGHTQALITKYDSDGTLLWQKNLGGSGQDYFYGVTIDASGNAYAVGNENSNLGPTNTQGLIAKYDSDGILLWQKTLGGGVGGHDYLNRIAKDPGGNVCVAGKEGSTTGNYQAILFSVAQDATGATGTIPDITSLAWRDPGLTAGVPGLTAGISTLISAISTLTTGTPALTVGAPGLTQILSNY